MDFSDILKQLPTKPGVYMMKDSLGNIIYVGKAKNLRNRVPQYFRKREDHSPKILDMVRNISSIEYITADTELDAFLTECRLIKEIKPKYNKQMKSHKGYCYIKINLQSKFPGITVITGRSDDGALYIGPLTSPYRAEDAVNFAKDHFPVRKCYASSGNKASACLNYSLGTCFGACRAAADPGEYRKHIDRLVAFFSGNDNSIVEKAQKKMEDACEKLDFEKAARYRDQLRGIRHVQNKQKLAASSNSRRNIAAAESVSPTEIKLFLIKGNKLLHSILLDMTEGRDKLAAALRETFMTYFPSGEAQDKKEFSQEDVDEAQIIYSYLTRHKNKIVCFWIPSNWLSEDSFRLAIGVDKIVDRLAPQICK